MFKGKCHADLGMYDKAIVDFKQGIAQGPEFRDNYEEDKGDLRLKDNLERLEKELNEPTNN